MAVYDPQVQESIADLLILRAKRIVPVFTAMAAIVGAGIGVAVSRGGRSEVLSIVLWTFVFGVIGFVAGKERAFAQRLKAQELLCQKKIEENTRMAAATRTAGAA